MKNARDHDPVSLQPIEDNVSPFFHPAQARHYLITCTPEHGLLGQPLHTVFNLGQIASGLGFPPGP